MKQIDFENGSITGNIFQSALPMLIAQVLNLMYSIVDRIYIGRIPGAGTEALGGIGLCFPIIIMVTAFTNLYGMGGAPLCAIERGKGNLTEARRIMNCAFTLLAGTSVLLMVSGLLFGRSLLYLFGATDSSILYALPYLRIYLLGTPFVMISAGMNPYINAQGFSQTGMLTTAIGAVSNLILDPVFIFGLGMGIRGAAIATVLAQLLSALFVLRFLLGRKSGAELKLRKDLIGIDWKLAGQIMSLGAVSFIMQFTNSLVSIVANGMLMRFGGELYVSVMTIVNSVRSVLDTPALAIAEGTAPILSYNYGAGRPKRIAQGITIMTGICFIYTLVTWILIERVPQLFIGIFTDDASLITAARPALHLYFFAFIFQTFQHVGQSTFKALNKKKRAIFFSLFRKAIMVVPLTLLLPRLFGLGTAGVFIAEPISNVVGGLACYSVMLLTIGRELKEMQRQKGGTC